MRWWLLATAALLLLSAAAVQSALLGVNADLAFNASFAAVYAAALAAFCALALFARGGGKALWRWLGWSAAAPAAALHASVALFPLPTFQDTRIGFLTAFFMPYMIAAAALLYLLILALFRAARPPST